MNPHRTNTVQEKFFDDNDKGLQTFRYMRPYLIKLLTHSIIIYISIRAYLSFVSSSNSYTSFLQTLEKPVVIDVKMIEYNNKCDSPYQDIDFSYFPEIKNGCQCNMNIFSTSVCSELRVDDPIKAANRCDNIDKLLKKSNRKNHNNLYQLYDFSIKGK